MKVTLAKVGGLLPVKKFAEAELDWTEEDFRAIETSCTREIGVNERDSISYLLSYKEKTFSLDWEKVPIKYKQALEQLKNNLQVKPF